MKYGIFTIPYDHYQIELKDYDLIYAFSEKDNVYWSTSILISDVKKIKNKELTKDEISNILKSLKYTRITYFDDNAKSMLKFSSSSEIQYNASKYKRTDFNVGEESKSRRNLKHMSYFIGEYEIPNKLEKLKNIFKDLYVFLDKKRINISEKAVRSIKNYDQNLFGIILIRSPDSPIYMVYAINEKEEAFVFSCLEQPFVDNLIELQKTNKYLLQEKLEELNFEKTEYRELKEYTRMFSTPKNKYENKFRYDLYNEMDCVYHGMGHGGFFIGNYYIRKLEKL